MKTETIAPHDMADHETGHTVTPAQGGYWNVIAPTGKVVQTTQTEKLALIAAASRDAARTESPRPEIIEHAARALFANAWADYQERAPEGVNLSGCEIMDVMPEVPQEAITAAEKLVADTEALNGETIAASLERAQALPDDSADRECNAEMFGHYLAMQALGTGVGLESVCDREALALKLPYCEFSYYDLPESDYPDFAEEG